MKTSETIFFLFIILLVFSSCKKNPAVIDKNMSNLEIPQDFDWSALATNQLTVNITGFGDGQPLSLYDLDGNKIDSKTIQDNKVEFSYRLPYDTDTLRLYSPINFLSKYILADEASVNFSINNGSKSKVIRSTEYALNFDGTSNYVEIKNEDNGGIVKGFPFSFSVWIKTPLPGSGVEEMALVNIADPNYASKYYGLSIRKYSDKYKAVIVARNGGSERVKSFNQNLADGTWHQITGVFVSDDSRELYIDGVYTGKSSSTIDWNPDAILTSIGRWGDNTPSDYYNGLIDNVCIWNKRLNESEVMAYYQNTPDGSEEDLVGLWNFDEGSGTTLMNLATSGGYPGENYGASYFRTSDPEDSDGDGIIDESDDFPADPDKAYLITYPSGSNYYFHLFEDLWPGMGDYDFNDVVLKTKLHAYKNSSNQLVGGKVVSEVYWIGGGIPRGVGMEYLRPSSAYSKLEYMPAETVTFTEMQNVITDPDVPNAVKLFDGNIIESLGKTVDFEYTWDHSLGGNSIWVQAYIYMNRSQEVHMYGHPPTTVADMTLFGTQHDASLTSWDWTVGNKFSMISDFYKTATNLPWGLEIETADFRVPNEKTEILDAYPQFQAWAESGGTVNRNWYKYPDVSKTFLPENKD